MPDRPLTANQIRVLSKMLDGYELAHISGFMIGGYDRLTRGKNFLHVNINTTHSLRQRGLIRPAIEKKTSMSAKTVYELTEEGRREADLYRPRE